MKFALSVDDAIDPARKTGTLKQVIASQVR
jgi:hypothetical protein